MSFGVSVGDFTVLGQLAWKLYRTCKDAPESFQDTSQEVLSLFVILKESEEIYSGTLLSATQRSRLEDIRNECHAVLEELQGILDNHNSLSSKPKRTLDRLGWRSNDSDIAELTSRLVSNTVLLKGFVNTSQITVRKKLDVFLQGVQEGKHKSSIISNQTLDSLSTGDGKAWRALRKELEDIGISIAAFDANKHFIVSWFRTAITTGAFAKQTPRNTSNLLADDPTRSFQDTLSPGFKASPGFDSKSQTFRPFTEVMKISAVQEQKKPGHSEYRTLKEKHQRPPPYTGTEMGDISTDNVKKSIKWAYLSQSGPEDPMGHIRGEIECNISTFPKDLQNTTIVVSWDLRKYIKQELEKDQKLEHILTVSGTAKKAYSTTCAHYVKRFWPQTGLWMLEILRVVIDRGFHYAEMATDATDPIVVNAYDAYDVLDGAMIIEVSSSRSLLISIAQQLAWLAAVTRTSSFQELTYSHVLFRHIGAKVFIITVLDVRQLPRGDEMCWHPLFPNTMIAYGFPVPPRSDEMGVEIPFDVMLRLARITYAVTYDNGLVLSGFSTLLFPSAHHKPKSQDETQSASVQWHLVTSDDESTRISAGAELAQHDHIWVKIDDEELLRSARTFLGHYRVSCVHLGTENSGFSNVSESSLADDKPNIAISVRSGNVGTSGTGIFGAAMNVEAVLPRGLTRLTKIDYYNDILWTAKNMPTILYDADKQQAWLVSTLSIILHMVHTWKATHTPDIQLPYAKPDWNGGQAAWDIISNNSRLKLQESFEDDTSYLLKDLVKRLWEHLISCFDSTTLDTSRNRGMIETGHPKLRGWEYMDVVDPPVRSKMKEQVLDRNGCGWEVLTEDVLLLVCKGLGDVIQPAQPGSLCTEVYPVQESMKYLTASVACLRHLSQKCGMGGACTKLADRVFWPSPPPGLFDDCTHGDEKSCPKTLQRLVPKEVHGPTTAVPAQGAVLFGHRTNNLKKKVPHSAVKKVSKQAANGHAVESANQGSVVNATHRSPGHNSHLLANGEPTVPAAYSEDIAGLSNPALADEQCTGSSNQEMTDENSPRALAQSTPKPKAELPTSHSWRRVFYR